MPVSDFVITHQVCFHHFSVIDFWSLQTGPKISDSDNCWETQTSQRPLSSPSVLKARPVTLKHCCQVNKKKANHQSLSSPCSLFDWRCESKKKWFRMIADLSIFILMAHKMTHLFPCTAFKTPHKSSNNLGEFSETLKLTRCDDPPSVS